MTTQRIGKGMILAAGLGTRLLPVTEKTPKPLVPVANVANVLYGVFLLREAGIREIVINLHHLGDHIERALGDGSAWHVKIAYSKEEKLLGTGGGLKKAEAFFGGEPLCLVNCDFVSDVKLLPHIERHFDREALATMLLYDKPELAPFYGKVGTNALGHLCSLPRKQIAEPSRSGIFTGIHVLSPDVFQYLAEEPSGINEVLYPALMDEAPERIWGDFLDGHYWHDTGERASLHRATMALLQSLQEGDERLIRFLGEFGGLLPHADGVWAPRGAVLSQGATFEGPVILGANTNIGSGSHVGPNVVLGDRSLVGRNARIARFVGFEETVVPEDAVVRDRLQYGELTLFQKNA
jgi:NDP-sugar pyrophosphorylase family protein